MSRVCLLFYYGQSWHGIGIYFERNGGQSSQPGKMLAENVGGAGSFGQTQAHARY